MEPVEDVVSEVRAYRLAIQGWAKGYAVARLLTPSCSKVDGETAGADLRRWSRLYFAASRRSRREADLAMPLAASRVTFDKWLASNPRERPTLRRIRSPVSSGRDCDSELRPESA